MRQRFLPLKFLNMHLFKHLSLSLVFMLFFFIVPNLSYSQNQNILCSPWCLGAHFEFKSEFGFDDCNYIIERTPNNLVIITGWCNYISSIANAKANTYRMDGTLLESLYNPDGWVESTYKTDSEQLIYHSRDPYPDCSFLAPCDVTVEVVEGVECTFLQNVQTGAYIFPLEYGMGVEESLIFLGEKLVIGYIPVVYPSYCLQGETQAIITCVSSLNEDTLFEICHDFENYAQGNIVPQGIPDFSLFSGLFSQNAQVVTDFAHEGSRSLKISNGSNIDFNISRQLTEDKVARVEWQMYIPQGMSGRVSLETLHPTTYAMYFEIKGGILEVFTFSNNGYSKVWTDYNVEDRWIPMAFIFQPFENDIEFWVDYYRIHVLDNYQSNKIEDINFTSLSNTVQSAYYIDDICYMEWNRDKICTDIYEPVCIFEKIYSNSCDAARDGYTENEYYPGVCEGPLCPVILYPINGAQNVSSNFTLEWEPAMRVQTYFLSVKNAQGTPLFSTILEGDITSYALKDLPLNEELWIELYPRNSTASSLCVPLIINTGGQMSLPACAQITYPEHNAENISTTVNLSWMASPMAEGYRLRAGTSPSTSDLLNNIDIGQVSNYVLNNLPSGTQICFTVIPYNEAGQNLNCSSTCFKTVTASSSEETSQTPGVFVYPVPAGDVLYAGNIDRAAYTILDITSRVWASGTTDHQNSISIQHLPPGFYFILLKYGQKTCNFKFQKI